MSNRAMSTPGPGSAGFSDALADVHTGYHESTQRHGPPDVLVDDVVTYRMLAPHLMRAGLFLVAPTVLLLIWLLLSYLASVSSPSSSASTITGIVGFLTVVLYVAGVAAFFAPAKEPIAEYSRLIEGRAGAAESATDWVRRAATARHAPADIRPSTVAGVPVLVFAQRSERAMLLVQPYGEDLYVGWTMWRSRSSATLLGHFLRDTFGRFASAPSFSAELRAAATRALRESVHSLAREGVAAAVHAGARPDDARGWSPSTGPATGSWGHDEHAVRGGDQRHDAGRPDHQGDLGRPDQRHDVGRPDHRGDALPPPSHQPAAWTDPAGDEALYTPRTRRREHSDADWGPPPGR